MDDDKQGDQKPVAAGVHDVEDQDDEAGYSGDHTLGGSRESCPHRITQDTYLELRDVVAAALASADGGESAHEQSAIVLDVGSRDCSGLVDVILLHVAKEFSANIISFDLDDLEDLAEDFERQQTRFEATNPALPERKQPDRKAAYGHAESFFGTYPNSSMQQKQLTLAAISAVLDGPNCKNRSKSPQDMPDHASHDTEVPTFVVVRGASDLMDICCDTSHQILARFRDQVQLHRAESQEFCIFTVIPDNPSIGYTPRERNDCTLKYLRWQLLTILQIDEASTVRIRQAACTPDIDAHEDLIRLFKRGLRRELSVKDESNLLVPYSQWLDEESLHTMQRLQTPDWDLEDIQRAVRQIQGRTSDKEVLKLQDILTVLRRIDRQKESAKHNPTGNGMESDGEVEDDSVSPNHSARSNGHNYVKRAS